MFSALFHKKAVGLHMDGSTFKYALITYNKNKIIVNESQSFDVYCKTALQRLQSLSKKYPTCALSSASNIFFSSPSPGVSKLEDQKKILQNKVEPLIEGQKTFVKELSSSKKPLYSFFVAKKEEVLKESLPHKVSFEKKILNAEALIVLERHFSKKATSSLVLYATPKKLLIYFFSEKKLTLCLCELIEGLSPQELAQKILRLCYANLKKSESNSISIHGTHPSLNLAVDEIKKASPFLVHLNEYGSFEDSHPLFLLEIGAALSILKDKDEGITPLSYRSFFKINRPSLLINFVLTFALLVTSSFYWRRRTSHVEAQSLALYQKASLALSEKTEGFSSLSHEQVEHLKHLLNKKKKESASYLYEPSIFLVSDTLAWLSKLESKVKKSVPSSSFVVENFKYHLSSSEKLKNFKEVKVSFSFSTDSSLVSRQLYEEISKAREIVDTSKKIDWNFQNDKYEVSFYLKKKAKKRAFNV